MRPLNKDERSRVSGAGEPTGSLTDILNLINGTTTTGTRKNNNGYGNGAESGPPPGNSGDHNPQLLTWNSGKKGVR